MGNNTGVIYGTVQGLKSSATVDLNWIQAEGVPVLRVGGDNNLITPTPRVGVAKVDKKPAIYILPFYWESTMVYGNQASALLMNWDSDNSYVATNLHGIVRTCMDFKKIIGGGYPDATSSDPSDATNLFHTFWSQGKDDLEVFSPVMDFIGDVSRNSAEMTAICCRIDF